MKLNLSVIGDPVAHSRSPEIHEKILTHLGCEVSYRKIHVKKGELLAFFKAEAQGLDGFNVTMPHKRDILPFLSSLEPSAALLSSVNTVSCKGGFKGHSTDSGGFALALEETGFDARNKKIAVLGAGGVSLPVISALEPLSPKNITVFNRTLSNALALKESAAASGISIEAAPLTGLFLCCDFDLLINATPLDFSFDDYSFLKRLPKDALVFDLNYYPPETPLMRECKALGISSSGGFSMLIFQALLADEIYLSQKLDKISLYHALFKK